MKGFNLFHFHKWYPFSYFGLTQPYYTVHIDTLFFTWCAILVLVLLAVLGRKLLTQETVAGYAARAYVISFIDMIQQSLPQYRYVQFSFLTTIFSFIFLCNIVLFFPFLEEPTKDLNTTLAFGIISFCFVQGQILRYGGIAHYAQEYLKFPLEWKPSHTLPSWRYVLERIIRFIANIVVSLLMLPLEIMGKLASIISLSFRLFGNIFGGSVITAIWQYFTSGSIPLQLLGIFTGINLLLFMFFGIFEGFIQAFVFTVLTLTYLSLGLQHFSTKGDERD